MEGAAEVRLINTVPSALAELVRGGSLPGSLSTVKLAGEPAPRALADQIHGVGSVKRLYNLYGPTEDTVYSIFTLVERDSLSAPPIGRSLSGSRAHVLGAEIQPVPVSVTGDLFL